MNAIELRGLRIAYGRRLAVDRHHRDGRGQGQGESKGNANQSISLHGVASAKREQVAPQVASST